MNISKKAEKHYPVFGYLLNGARRVDPQTGVSSVMVAFYATFVVQNEIITTKISGMDVKRW